MSAARSSDCSRLAASRQRRAPRLSGRWSPPGPLRPSASGSSSASAYADRWSGASRRAASSVARQSSTVWPGTSESRSTPMDVDPGRPPRSHRVGDVRDRVSPPQASQEPAVKALGADRQARHAGGTESGQVAAVVGSRVGLERDLRARRDAEPAVDVVEQTRDRRGRQQGWRATPDVDARQRRVAPAGGRRAGRARRGARRRAGRRAPSGRGPPRRRRPRSRSTGRPRRRTAHGRTGPRAAPGPRLRQAGRTGPSPPRPSSPPTSGGPPRGGMT